MSSNLQSDAAANLLSCYLSNSRSAKAVDITALCSGLDGTAIAQDDRYNLENAVARICPYPVIKQLPLHWSVPADDPFVLTRALPDNVLRPQTEIPQHLFTINWADSGPGYAWLEAYYLILVPELGHYVVTASADSWEVYGCLDLAIGHFDAELPLMEGVHQCIVDWWRTRESQDGQARWAYLFTTGLVSAQLAHAWREEVWRDE